MQIFLEPVSPGNFLFIFSLKNRKLRDCLYNHLYLTVHVKWLFLFCHLECVVLGISYIKKI